MNCWRQRGSLDLLDYLTLGYIQGWVCDLGQQYWHYPGSSRAGMASSSLPSPWAHNSHSQPQESCVLPHLTAAPTNSASQSFFCWIQEGCGWLGLLIIIVTWGKVEEKGFWGISASMKVPEIIFCSPLSIWNFFSQYWNKEEIKKSSLPKKFLTSQGIFY